MNLDLLTKILFITGLAVLLLTGCKDDDSPVSPASDGGLTANSNVQVSFEIDGIKYDWKLPPDGTGNNRFENITSGGPMPDTVIFGALIEPSVGSPYDLIIYKGNCIFPAGEDSNIFYNFFQKSTIPYSDSANGGIQIVYVDSNYGMWATDKGVKDQTGSLFRIIDTHQSTILGDHFMQAYIQFNCKLYNDSGDIKILSGGTGVYVFKLAY